MTARRTGGPSDVQDERPYDASRPEIESFEELFARLEQISEALEQGGLTLDESVALYEEGMRVAQRCQQLLGEVEQRIETLRQQALSAEDYR